MTEKLYYKDSHIFNFSARVTECSAVKDGFAVCLDRTAFFPEGGGQAADTGCIGNVRVLDVQEENGRIFHFTKEALTAGMEYSCAVDREQRLRRMQSHSGEHIVSGITHSLYGYDNVGFHMGEDGMTIDFSGELDEAQLSLIEKRANEAVRANLPIRCLFPEALELESLEYRSKLELTENVRIVEIEGIDRCACCAPHVKSTGEVGLIKITDHMRHRGGVRVSLVCGMDALDYINQVHDSAVAASRALSVKRHELAPAVERILSEQIKSRERIAALSYELARVKAEAVAETEGNICIFDNVLDENALRELVNLLMKKCSGYAAAFSGSDAEGYRYIIGSDHLDMRSMAKEINKGIDGRGGGRSEMIQGRASADAQTIRAFVCP